MKLEVLFDPAKNLATLIDMDAGQGFGPAVPGPEAGSMLESWLEVIPFDLDGSTSEQVRDFFHSSINRTTPAPGAAESPPAAPAAPAGGEASAVAPQAVTEAHAPSDGAPPPQPADTDPTATAGLTPADTPAAAAAADQAPPPPAPTTETRACPNCNGAGSISYADENGQTVTNQCGMCAGSGKVQVNG